MITSIDIMDRLVSELEGFDGADFTNGDVISAMNSVLMMTLVDIQDDEPLFDVKVNLSLGDLSPTKAEPLIELVWWIGMQGLHHTFEITFNPLRIIDMTVDHNAAYDRAMSIL